MGYTTEFQGFFILDRPLSQIQAKEIREFMAKRHNAYKMGPGGRSMENEADYAPSFYCQWELTEDNQRIQWDHGEKFYGYTEWLRILITRFFEPWGYLMNGSVKWRGEDFEDIGKITVRNNQVITRKGW